MKYNQQGRLSPRDIGPYWAIRKVGKIAYELDLSSEVRAVHLMFRMPMLRKYIMTPIISPVKGAFE